MSRWQTKIKNLALILVFIIFFSPAAFAQEQQSSPEADTGILYYTVEKSFSGRKPVTVHIVTADLKVPNVIVDIVLAGNTVGKLRTTGNIAVNNDAVAAINGGFFDRYPPHIPVGLVVIDGKIVTKSLLNRSAIGISPDMKIKFGIPKFSGYVVNQTTKDKIAIFGMNRPRKDDETIIYTPEYGWTTKTNDTGVEIIVEDNMVVGISDGNSPIPRNGYVISFHGWTKNYANELPPGAPIESVLTLTEDWNQYDHVLSGGPRLLDNGRNVVAESMNYENFDSEVMGRNSRTAIGIDSNDVLYMVVVEGKKRRRGWKKLGATYTELADMLKDLGLKDAIGLDGGGSSTMYVDGEIVNRPLDGCQQLVSNAVILKFAKKK